MIDRVQSDYEALFQDKVWRMTNLYSISTKAAEKIVFLHNPVQVDIQKHLDSGQVDLVILKARQHGVTTFFSLYYFDEVLWRENVWACIVAHNRETLATIFSKIQYAWDNLDPELREAVGTPKTDTKYELFWRERNSKIYVTLKTEGCTNQFLHFSEYAQISEENIGVSLPTVPPGGMIVRESTPFGIGNRFHREYTAAKRKEITMTPLFYEWWWSSEYQLPVYSVKPENLSDREKQLVREQELSLPQLQWRRDEWEKQKQADGSNLFPQNYAEDDVTCFLSSGDLVFNTEALQLNMGWLDKNPQPCIRCYLYIQGGRVMWREDKKGPARIYETPQKLMDYAAGVDISLGLDRGDYQTIQIIRRDTKKVVFTYRNKTELSQFLLDGIAAFHFYNGCWVCPERNSYGEAYIKDLLETYNPGKVYKQLNALKARAGIAERYGYYTGGGRSRGKVALVSLLQRYITDGNLIPDRDTVEEAMQFQFMDSEGIQTGAKAGHHDDLVMALSLALEMDNDLGVYRMPLALKQQRDVYYQEKSPGLLKPATEWYAR